MRKETVYTDLFEDEVAEVLRDLPFRSEIIEDRFHSYRPAAAIDEDGIVTSGAGLFLIYLNGQRNGYVGAQYLVQHLAHTTFTTVI